MTRCILTLSLFLATSPAWAICVGIDRIDDVMRVGHGEYRVEGGIVGDGQTLMVRYENPETGSWTLVEITPNRGMACSRISGVDWRPVEGGPGV